MVNNIIELNSNSSVLSIGPSDQTDPSKCNVELLHNNQRYILGPMEKSLLLGKLVENLAANDVTTFDNDGRIDGFLVKLIGWSHTKCSFISLAIEQDNYSSLVHNKKLSIKPNERCLFFEKDGVCIARFILTSANANVWLRVLRPHYTKSVAMEYEMFLTAMSNKISPQPTPNIPRNISNELLQASENSRDWSVSSIQLTLTEIAKEMKPCPTFGISTEEGFKNAEYWSSISGDSLSKAYVYGTYPLVFYRQEVIKNIDWFQQHDITLIPFSNSFVQEFVIDKNTVATLFPVYHGPKARLVNPFSIEELIMYTL